jgi:DNA-directed RNA polymerase specialized sigma24 family protein
LQRAADRARQSERRKQAKLTSLAHPELIAGPGNSREPSAHETKLELVRTALAKLNERDRSLLDALLRGRKLLDVAAELSLTPHAIRKRFHRAIERIRQLVASQSG